MEDGDYRLVKLAIISGVIVIVVLILGISGYNALVMHDGMTHGYTEEQNVNGNGTHWVKQGK